MIHEFTIGHLFSGIGGGAFGAAQARVAIGDHEAVFRTLGGVDIDGPSCRDFEMLVDAPALEADVATLTPTVLRAAWGDEAPDMVLLSPPCKGFSALLSKENAKREKYQKLNKLVTDGLFLLCSTWNEPPPIIFLENVPRITSRGRELLARARRLLEAHGYVVTGDDYHDCGELGGLAQHRRRFFLVARCPRRVPNLIYQPPKLRVRACGEVLAPLSTPGDEIAGGPMHQLPRIAWLTWVRLALIPAGGDWRDLPAGSVELGQTGENAASFKGRPKLLGVADWQRPTGAVTSSATVTGSAGTSAVADPRFALSDNPNRHHNKYTVQRWAEPASTVIGASRPGSGAPSVADPRCYRGVLGVGCWDEPSGVVTGGAAPSRGRFSVADPRLGCRPRSGAYGVLGWQEAAATITGALAIDNGRAAIADPRPPATVPIEGIPENPKRPPDFTPVIVAADGTWHRPLTTLELAVLQSLPPVLRGSPLKLHGTSTTSWRERIGNMIPPAAAQAIASELLLALLASRLETFRLSSTPIWVAPVEVVA